MRLDGTRDYKIFGTIERNSRRGRIDGALKAEKACCVGKDCGRVGV